ncbi:MAG TPA: ORF6N domain-containing protein [Terriglobales bacterium]|nr:ORF6N domain-containing protein [Terriglobales bacterium]
MRRKVTILAKRVESKILLLRGRKVILDSDLAELYGFEVKRLNEQVKRNADRFPMDFVFRLQQRDLRSQIATSNETEERRKKRSLRRGGRRYQPFAFTEHGAIMAATVLNSKRAVEMSIFVVRAFVRMREALATSQKIMAKLRDLEDKFGAHDAQIQEIVEAIQEMMTPPLAELPNRTLNTDQIAKAANSIRSFAAAGRRERQESAGHRR